MPPASDRPARWTLSRAGIINVYQYGDETLEFGGGRLLLRGVNGSGKSTAMNMLLPFLLDADTRRIDAAGEQSGVLRAWMLSGRDEPQPQGYLWLEVAKGDAYLNFGCGIRANRATDQVTTWWFITSRRIGLDLHLVEGRVPVSRDALRVLLEPDPLFGQDQRADYRAELRRRIFGGADIEQHLHLLRTVRSPRVGDRLDAELPQYLMDALPQLSDSALDDAAQPLEDLDEHRRNVAELARTAEALDAVYAMYQNYARAELHDLADRTLEAARMCRELRRSEDRARTNYEEALGRRASADSRKMELEADVDRLRSAIAALEGSEAYMSGAQLNDLRSHVGSLKRAATAAEGALRSRCAATERAAKAAGDARHEVATDRDILRRRTSDLGHLASACLLTARPPDPPSLAPALDSPGGFELAPIEPIETARADAAFSTLNSAARDRQKEVETVESAVRAIEPAERAVRDAERSLDVARAANDEARERLAEARATFQSATLDWRADVGSWMERVRLHHIAHDIDNIETLPDLDGLIDELVLGQNVATRIDGWIAPAVRHHEGRRADRLAALGRQGELVAEIEGRAAELAKKQFPEPPVLAWQQRTARCFAEFIDFAGHVEPIARAGLEAALEASGLLAAEVLRDGSLRLADGQLLVMAAAGEAAAPLSAVLRAEVPAEDADPAVAGVIERILQAISTDPAAAADTVVTVDGEFRIGLIRGKHSKPEAEHIGVGARRAAMERQQAECAHALEDAKADQSRLAGEVGAAQAALDDALLLRANVPADQAMRTAFWRRGEAENVLEKSDEQLGARGVELAAAEQHHAEAVTYARIAAARLSLPAALDALRAVRDDIAQIISQTREARGELGRFARGVERWRDRGADWRAARDDEQQSRKHFDSVSVELGSTQERLTTLDATIGAAYKDVIAAIERSTEQLSHLQDAFRNAESLVLQAVTDVATAVKDSESAAAARERAEAHNVLTLTVLRRALTVPGLIDAAADPSVVAHQDLGAEGGTAVDTAAEPGAVAFPMVDDTAAGARQLGELIRTKIPRSAEPLTTADGVRQSIRRRRDSLGAGWDAEDRQPDEQLPLHIEVTGPLAQQTPLAIATQIVQRQLATMAGLLSTKQHQALRNLLQGLVAREVAERLHAAGELIDRMNERLSSIRTSHGIGVNLRWRLRDDLDPTLAETVDLLAKPPDLRTAAEDSRLSETLGLRIDEAHREDPGTPYRELIARVLDYREWHSMTILLHRPGRKAETLSRRTALSEGEKKIVSYLPLFAAVAASCDGLGASAPDALRFVLLDDAFAKVSEDNHPKLFGLLVELDLDFIATSERLWGTYDTVPELAITEVIRDADLAMARALPLGWSSRKAGMTETPDLEPDMPAQPAVPAAQGANAQAAGRDLFRYVVTTEWADYRAIMGVFADTFFSEFAPEDVAARLADAGHMLETVIVGERLDSLRRWGNLTVSSAVGNPQSIQDYYRRRNRYLITRAGQEVHQLVEGVLTRVDAVTDVSTARLRALIDALERLAALDAHREDPTVLADAVGAVFDPHEAFTAEITQLFAAINQWQSRYDLSPEELRFFAEVLVGYVGERLEEIERAARPIGHQLAALGGKFATLAERANKGLAGRIVAAGLSGSVAVRHRAGSRLQDWQHLCGWFLRVPGRPSRIETLTREAIAAVRTLTLNLTRLSRVGVGSASRRADFLRLAQFLERAPGDTHRLAAAAFGLTPTNHFGTPSVDAGDPVSTTTSWWDAPRAEVAISIRERGDTTPRGRITPMPDRTQQRMLVEQRRAAERAARDRVDHELLDEPTLDGRTLSAGALARLQEIIGRTSMRLGTRPTSAEWSDGSLICRIERTPGRHMCVHAPAGTLTLLDLAVSIRSAGAVAADSTAMLRNAVR